VGQGWKGPKVDVEPYSGSPAGPGPKQFLIRVEQLKIGRRLSDRDLLDSWIPTLLVDEALDWFLGHESWTSWAEFKFDFKSHFQLPNADDGVYRAIVSRRQKSGESVAVYAEDMLRLFRQLAEPATEKEKIRFIRLNMDYTLRFMLSTHSYDTVRALIADARLVETEAGIGTPGEKSAEKGPRREAESTSSGPRARACYICNDTNHLAGQCPQRVGRSQEGQQSGNARGTPPDTGVGSQKK
jgi:hypothetical protein